MPVIRVEMLSGRTREQKRALIKELTDGFIRTCGGKPESVQIVLIDVDKTDWGSAGEAMADK